ncbi:iron ABC transporter substrate-binding protein, partial [Bacteroides thetaiotaomicron]|nr:iron ABC transporter substrate-binding protein [Bacteroides thetaiotaomicron]
YPQQFKDLDVKATQAELHRHFLAIAPQGAEWVDAPLPAASSQAAR